MTRNIKFPTVQAKLDGASRTTVYRLIEGKIIPKPFKIGRFNYWDEQELDAAIDALRSQAA